MYINGFLSVVFVGPSRFDLKNLATMFRVRKAKVWDFLLWLKHHNRLYADIPLDSDILNLYPDDGVIPGLGDCVVEDNELVASAVFEEETAGFESHPVALLLDPGDSSTSSTTDEEKEITLLEKMGVSDPESVNLNGQTFTALALRNLVPGGSNCAPMPNLIVYRGSRAIGEYNNPDLLPGMYPSLFPLGIGGFEYSTRPTPISFQHQAQYLLNICDRSFRYHHSFMFVALNIIQRQTAHLHTYFTCKRSNFLHIARQLTQVSSRVLENLASRLENEWSLSELGEDEKNAFSLLKHVNTIAARIPGSKASKIFIRNEIRSYYGYFGLPHLFFTFNPSAAHSPILQVMCGDQTVDLSNRFPRLVSARERAIRLAKDPVAAADFFEFSVRCCFEYLLGWDYKKGHSSEDGGILGQLHAFYGTSEYTEHGIPLTSILNYAMNITNHSFLPFLMILSNTTFQTSKSHWTQNLNLVLNTHLPLPM